MLRSEAMAYVQINAKTEFRVETMRALARVGRLHLVDLGEEQLASLPDNDFAAQEESVRAQHRELKRRVTLADTYEKDLAALETLMGEFSVEVPAVHVVEYKSIDVLEKVQRWLEPVQAMLRRNLEFKRQTAEQLLRLREHMDVIAHVLPHLPRVARVGSGSGNGNGAQRSPDDSGDERLSTGNGGEVLLDEDDVELGRMGAAGEAAPRERFHNYVYGMIHLSQQPQFERLLFRVSRGNALAHFVPLEEPQQDAQSKELVHKSVFYVACVGRNVYEKVRRLAEHFNAAVFELPRSREECERELERLRGEAQDREFALSQTVAEIVQMLREVAYTAAQGRSPLREWQLAVKKERAVMLGLRRAFFYTTMFVLEGWCPVADLEELRARLHPEISAGTVALTVNPDAPIGPRGTPPTLFRTTKFTSAAQELVNTYGVPRYREMNPAVFTVVSFPFIFALMYGDVAHGGALLAVAAALVLNEGALEARRRAGTLGEFLGILFHGRYMLLLMGAFAVYVGFIYNDCASVPLPLLESSWDCAVAKGERCKPRGAVYAFGVDHSWYGAHNELLFFNSLKMKASIVFGVVQMTLGIVLSAFNHSFFGDRHALLFEFVPQLVFMLSTFGYLVFLIFFKYAVDWAAHPGSQPPNLIQTLIQMYLAGGDVPAGQQMFAGQEAVQLVLVFVALACVPLMLLGKPLAEHYGEGGRAQRAASGNGGGRRGAAGGDGGAIVAGDASPSLSPSPSPSPAAVGAAAAPSYSRVGQESDDEKAPLADEVDSAAAATRRRGGAQRRAQDEDTDSDFDELEEGSLSQALIYQAIHTIEFVLGAVSNTASYLRLWALSLAHAELAKVFWDKLIVSAVATGSPWLVAIGVSVWILATTSVLLLMDVLECFLHALRLHWVEFQNKFFYADGFPFEAFSFDAIDQAFFLD